MPLSEAQVTAGRRLRVSGAKWREIGGALGVTASVAHHAVKAELSHREWALRKWTYEAERTDMPDSYRAEFRQKLDELNASL